MYTTYYNLKAKPFQTSSDPDFIWLGEKHKEALATLTYGVLDNKGFMLLTGDVGTGKTTLINTLINGLSDDILYASVPDPRLGLNDFLNYVASAFNIKKVFKTKGKFLVHFSEFLLRAHEDGKKVLLLIDEAQLLTQDMLEEIRLLSNIQKNGINLLNIFFIGQDEFNEILERQENRAVTQRLTLNYHLEPLTEQETESYIRHRLTVAGTTEQLFDEEALREIQAYSGGFPRRINIICDHCLLTGFVKEQRMVDAGIVRTCAHDLKIPHYTGHRTPPQRPLPPQIDFTPPPVAAPAAPSVSLPIQPVAPQPVPSRPLPRQRPALLKPAVTALILILGAGLLLFYLDPATFHSIYAEARQYLISATEKLDGSTLRQNGTDTGQHLSETVPGDKQNHPQGGSADEKMEPPGENTDKPAAIPDPNRESADRPTPVPAPEPAVSPVPIEKPEPVPAEVELPEKTINVRFDNDSSEFFFTDLERVDDFVAAMKRYPDAIMVISGHSDSLGSEGYNYRLSLFRANMVKSFFLGKGIPSYQLKVRAFGGEKPLMSNDTEEGRRMNRRVEIDVVQ